MSAFRVEARSLVILAAPVVATQLGQMAVGTTDVVMLGAVSKDALAAAALGFSIYFTALMFAMGPANAVAPMIAHHLGGNPDGTRGPRIAVRMALWASLLVAMPVILLLSQAEATLLMLGEPSTLSHDAARFVRILCIGMPFALCYQVLRGYVTALSRPTAALFVTLLTVLVNGIADYALIFGHFGAPALGLRGSALASAASLMVSLVAMVLIIMAIPVLRRGRPFAGLFDFDGAALRAAFRLGIPIGFSLLFEVSFFSVGALIAGHFGAAVVAANQIALNVASLSFMIPLGIGTAASVRVGLAAGAGDWPRARLAGFTALGLSASVMSLIAVVLAVWPQAIAQLYVGRDIEGRAPLIALTVTFLRYAAAFQLFDSLQVTATYALRGLKDTAAPMWIAGFGYWLVGFPLALWLSFGFGRQGVGIWIAFCVSLIFVAATLTFRFQIKSRVA